MNKTTHHPIVTIEQAVNYDPAKPETATPSRIVNLLVETIPLVHGVNQRSLAKHLGISAKAVAGAVEFDTGLTFDEFLDQWRIGMVCRLKLAKIKVKGDGGAHQLGFYNRTSLWLFLTRVGLNRTPAQQRAAETAFRTRMERIAKKFDD